MGKYNLMYLNIRGRGEAIRYLLIDNNIEYDETLVDIPTFISEWKSKMPFRQIPCLHDGNFQLVQFNSILRHFGRKHNLYGDGIEEAAMIDMISDGIEDVRKKYTQLIYSNYENGKQEYIDNLPTDLECFEKILADNDAGKTGFCVGKRTSLVDYNMFDILDIHLVLSPSCLDKFPALSGFHKAMLARPNISAYRQTDKFKQRTINYGPNQ